MRTRRGLVLLALLAILPGRPSQADAPRADDEKPTSEEREATRSVLQSRRAHLQQSLGFCRQPLDKLPRTGEELMELSDRREARGLKPPRVELQAYRFLGLATDIELRGSGNCLQATHRDIDTIDATLGSPAALDRVVLQTRELRRTAREQLRASFGTTVSGLQAATRHDPARADSYAELQSRDFFNGIARQWQQYESWKQAGYVDTFADPVFAAARVVYDDVESWRVAQALARDARALEGQVARARMPDASVGDRVSLPDTLQTLVTVRQRLAEAVSRHDAKHQEAERSVASAGRALQP
jgi:hypothetical protein